MSKELIAQIIDEDIDCLRESLTYLQRMNTKGVDKYNSEFFRRIKQEFIEQTKSDIDWMLNFRKNLSSIN